jgi:hypothetical protein
MNNENHYSYYLVAYAKIKNIYYKCLEVGLNILLLLTLFHDDSTNRNASSTYGSSIWR